MIRVLLCVLSTLIGRKLSLIVGGHKRRRRRRRTQQAGGSTPKASVIASSDANDVVGGIEWDIPLNFRQIDWFAFNGHKSRRVGCQPASQPLPQVKQLYSSSGGMDWNWAETERDRG